jgi:DNA excision repair protein ERCC-4
MLIVVDSREQAPFLFQGNKYREVEAIPGALPTGDYSLPGFENRVAVERKSLDDLVGCLMNSNRDRFERELFRAAPYDLFCVVVEASMEQIRNHQYQSLMKPKAVLQSMAAFQVRYRVPFAFCGGRAGAEYWTYSLLVKYLRDIEERMRVLRFGQPIAV